MERKTEMLLLIYFVILFLIAVGIIIGICTDNLKLVAFMVGVELVLFLAFFIWFELDYPRSLTLMDPSLQGKILIRSGVLYDNSPAVFVDKVVCQEDRLTFIQKVMNKSLFRENLYRRESDGQIISISYTDQIFNGKVLLFYASRLYVVDKCPKGEVIP